MVSSIKLYKLQRTNLMCGTSPRAHHFAPPPPAPAPRDLTTRLPIHTHSLARQAPTASSRPERISWRHARRARSAGTAATRAPARASTVPVAQRHRAPALRAATCARRAPRVNNRLVRTSWRHARRARSAGTAATWVPVHVNIVPAAKRHPILVPQAVVSARQVPRVSNRVEKRRWWIAWPVCAAHFRTK